MENKKPLPDTLEELAECLDFISDVATGTRDLQFASHLLLSELLKHLDRIGIMNGREFITNIRTQIPAIPELYHQQGVEVVCSEMLIALEISRATPIDGAVH